MMANGDPFIRLGALEYTQSTQQAQLLLLHQHLEILTQRVRQQAATIQTEFAELQETPLTQQQRFISKRIDTAIHQVMETLNPSCDDDVVDPSCEDDE